MLKADTEGTMPLGRNSTLPYRPGDRIRTRHHETGCVVSIRNNVLVIKLDSGNVVTSSVFDVTLAAPAPANLSPGSMHGGPMSPSV